MLPYPLTNFEIQRDDLPDKIKDGVYVINLDEDSDIGTHSIVLHALNNNVTYFDSFGVEHIQQEIKMDIFVLELLILCFQGKLKQTLRVFFYQTILKRMMT